MTMLGETIAPETFGRTSVEDQRRLQTYADGIVEAIARLGLSVSIEADMGELMHFLKSCGAFPYPAFDPEQSDLDGRAFWLKVVDKTGKVVASRGQKIVEADDFMDLLYSGKLWFRNGADIDPVKTQYISPSRRLSGRISHGGAVFVLPEHRKKGLSMWLPWLGHINCMQTSDPDWYNALVWKGIAEGVVARDRYCYPHIERCVVGVFPAKGKDDGGMWLCYMDRNFAVRKAYELADDKDFPISIPAESRLALAG
jgi:GNAT superfamily N-acetyltransferase